MKHRLIEYGKSILIVLLALVVCILMLLVVYQGQLENVPLISTLTGFLGLNGTEPVYAAAETTTYEAARPDVVVLTTQEGHNTVSGGFDEIDAVFDVMGRFLSEALEAAQTPQAVSLEQWQAALAGQGVYFHYQGAIPFSALADWLRASAVSAVLADVQSGSLLLSAGADGTVLFYYIAEDAYWCCETGLDAGSLREQLETWQPDGSIFAFESSLESIARLDGDSVLNLTAAPAVQNAAASNPVESSTGFVNSAASELGFNPWGDSGYTASDGSRVFSDGDCRLTVSADGLLEFIQLDLTAARFTAASDETAALIEAARTLLSSLMEGGDAQLYLTGFVRSGETATLEFMYFLDGRPVRLSSGAAATVVFSGDILTSLTLQARTYTLLESTTTLLPAAQAAALAAEGGYLSVEYADSGGTELACGWTDGT